MPTGDVYVAFPEIASLDAWLFLRLRPESNIPLISLKQQRVRAHRIDALDQIDARFFDELPGLYARGPPENICSQARYVMLSLLYRVACLRYESILLTLRRRQRDSELKQ
jgi:hypothetical protein